LEIDKLKINKNLEREFKSLSLYLTTAEEVEFMVYGVWIQAFVRLILIRSIAEEDQMLLSMS